MKVLAVNSSNYQNRKCNPAFGFRMLEAGSKIINSHDISYIDQCDAITFDIALKSAMGVRIVSKLPLKEIGNRWKVALVEKAGGAINLSK